MDADAEVDMKTFSKKVGNGAQPRAFVDNRNNTANLYKAYTSYDGCLIGNTNGGFDPKFIMFQNCCNLIKM